LIKEEVVYSTVNYLLVPAQDGFFDTLGGIYALLFSCVGLLLALAVIAGMWLIFQKAGEAGWKSIIPIYNIYVMLEIIGRPGWWVILYFIPVINFFVWVIMMIDLAKSFDRGIGFAIGLMFLPVIFYPLLGFSDMQYYGPAAKS
jgi:hypothetical protein